MDTFNYATRGQQRHVHRAMFTARPRASRIATNVPTCREGSADQCSRLITHVFAKNQSDALSSTSTSLSSIRQRCPAEYTHCALGPQNLQQALLLFWMCDQKEVYLRVKTNSSAQNVVHTRNVNNTGTCRVVVAQQQHKLDTEVTAVHRNAHDLVLFRPQRSTAGRHRSVHVPVRGREKLLRESTWKRNYRQQAAVSCAAVAKTGYRKVASQRTVRLIFKA